MSNASLKPIIVWGLEMGPNPLKVCMLLEELGLPYEHKILDFPDMKKEPFLSLNPNGRVPAIEDPNTGLRLFESGPIVEYLVEQYDRERKISYESFEEKWLVKQWIGYQISGQGPYYGQYIWFAMIHPEKLPSAIERYRAEAERVRSVLDLHLSRRAGETQGSRVAERDVWLVGDKCTVADLSWFIWEQIMDFAFGRLDVQIEKGKYPHYEAWYKKLEERPSAQKAIHWRNEGMKNFRTPLRAD
ncbi:thioredoxin-like protein [Xylaria bambusicola]|uniref:thioredoxin-like protein n=1 Tax=Xylaria bambusicola TaxID=326684 RepID=UPI0020087F2D|nr:thioredoxin-like protein [Xylaria bambusicola]KAI0506213.1 thioredoxin-like protein [Xylaria bambusicola]